MMRKGTEPVAVTGSSWLCVIALVCTWLWLIPAAFEDEVVDIILAYVAEDEE